MEKNNYSKAQTLEMLKNADPKLLRKFVIDKVKLDDNFGQEIWTFFDRALNKKLTPENFEKFFSKAVKEIKETLKKSHNKRFGYIEYRVRSAINKLVMETLKQIRSQAPSKQIRIRKQLDLLRLLIGEDIEAMDESYDKMIASIIDDFKEIYEKGDHQDKRTLFDECMKFLSLYQKYDFEMDEVDYFVLEFYEEVFTEEIKDYINGRIKFLSSQSSFDRKQQHELGSYVEEMLNILSKEGVTENELLDYAKDYWDIPDVRQWFIWTYKESKEFDKAIRLTQECLEMDKDHSDLLSSYKKTLKELYRMSSQEEKYQQMLLRIIQESDRVEIDAFRELRSLFSPEEWAKYREAIFEQKKDQNWLLAKYLIEDNLIDRLAELLLSETTSYHLFNDYAPLLPSEYDSRVLERYKNYFTKSASQVTSRKEYQYLLSSLKDVYKVPGGRELANQLTSQWLVEHSNRPAFCEEIRNFQSEE